MTLLDEPCEIAALRHTQVDKFEVNMLNYIDALRQVASTALEESKGLREEVERLRMFDCLRTDARAVMLKDADTVPAYLEWLGKPPQRWRESFGGNEIWNAATEQAESRVEELRKDAIAAANLIDRSLKMMQMAGYEVVEHNPDHNNPLIAWMADARAYLDAVIAPTASQPT